MAGLDEDKLICLLERLVVACEALGRRPDAGGRLGHTASSSRDVQKPSAPVAEPRAESLELPAEVSTARAAEILGVSKDTVLEYRKKGLLRYRDTTPPGSSKPAFVYPLDDVVRLRTTYQTEDVVARQPVEPARRPVKGRRRYKHLDIDD